MKHFTAFLAEALSYVNAWTPTEIDLGGCGVFASILSDKLTELNIEHKIYALYYYKDSKTDDSHIGRTNFRHYLKEHDDKSLKKAGEDHIIIYLTEEELYIDDRGIINPLAFAVDEKIEISRETLQALIDKGDWNPIFDRDCIPFIKEKIDFVFKNNIDYESGTFEFPKPNSIKYTEKTIKNKRKQGSMESLLSSIMNE